MSLKQDNQPTNRNRVHGKPSTHPTQLRCRQVRYVPLQTRFRL
nr:MAG TPA: hypothetical protein [Caudoviricetes sp.]